jgi:SsrA-binding protein
MRVVNRKARFQYQIVDRFEAGISLEGQEAKSVFLGRIHLDDAYVKIHNGQALLINAVIPQYESARAAGYDPGRTRRLLLHKREILALATKTEQKNLTLVPITCYNKGRKIKLEIGLVRGKRQFEKKEDLKRKEQERDLERDLSAKS